MPAPASRSRCCSSVVVRVIRGTSRGLVDRLASREGSAPALPRRLGWHKARPSDVWMGGQGFDPTLATGPFTRSRSTLAVDLAYHRLVISAAANCSEFSIVLRGQSPVSAHRLEKSPIICPITAGKSAASDLGHRAPSPLLSMVRKGDSNPTILRSPAPRAGEPGKLSGLSTGLIGIRRVSRVHRADIDLLS
jgi:hypothetical protein